MSDYFVSIFFTFLDSVKIKFQPFLHFFFKNKIFFVLCRVLTNESYFLLQFDRKKYIGEMAEWLKAHAWKACIGETLSRVRIPLPPH